MNGYSANIPFQSSNTKRSLNAKIIDVLFVTACNIISAFLWITATGLEWFEGFFAQTAIEALGDSLILLYVSVQRLLMWKERTRLGKRLQVSHLIKR